MDSASKKGALRVQMTGRVREDNAKITDTP